MSASVLGKRSRRVIDAEDIDSNLPATKRVTRRQAPRIYEDATDKYVQQAGSRRAITELASNARAKSQRSAGKRLMQAHESKADSKSTCIKTLHLSTEREDFDLDLENLPPVVQTPTTFTHKDTIPCKLPVTHRHRVRLFGALSSSRPSQSPKQSLRNQSPFAAARQLFTQSSNPTKLIGRDSERKWIRNFISNCVDSQAGGCAYVSGPPGTGKSALVQEVFQEFQGNDKLPVSIINCVSLRTAAEVYKKLLLDLSPESLTDKAGIKQRLSKLFSGDSAKCMQLVLLDEIDNLLETDCEILYTIFEWALHKSSSMILVGIANALDLTDRFLPRLRARSLKPQLLPFLPYTATQISNIISDKFRSLLPNDTTAATDFIPFMQPAAVQLCGKKIASQTGDLRKAFSLVRRILDQVEQETVNKQITQNASKGEPLSELSNFVRSPPPTPGSSFSKQKAEHLSQFSPETAPRASIAHAAKMAASIFNNGTLSRLSGLNLQQKAVLCSLVSREMRKMERDPYATPTKSSNKTPTIKDLFTKYSSLCRRDEGLLQPLKDTEFRDVVASLETLGLVHEQRGRNSSLLTPTSTPSRAGRSHDDRQMVSAVSEKEMRNSLSGAGADLLQRLLDEA